MQIRVGDFMLVFAKNTVENFRVFATIAIKKGQFYSFGNFFRTVLSQAAETYCTGAARMQKRIR